MVLTTAPAWCGSKKVGQESSPANHRPAAKHWWPDVGLPRATGLHRPGSSRLSCNAKRPSQAGISIAKIAWIDGGATSSNTGQREEGGLKICGTWGMGELAQSDRLGSRGELPSAFAFLFSLCIEQKTNQTNKRQAPLKPHLLVLC